MSYNKVEFASKELAKAAREVQEYYAAAGVVGGKSLAVEAEVKDITTEDILLMTRKERKALAKRRNKEFVPIENYKDTLDKGWV